MKKLINILFVTLLMMVMLCACDPTVGDDGGDEDRRVIELTFEIESLEAQVNGADSSTDLSALMDWADSCQIKIDTLRIEGESETLDALEDRIEAVKKLIEEKKYPIVICTEQGVDDLLNWMASNELYYIHYNPISGVQAVKGEEPYVRYEHDLEEFIEFMLSNMETYSWVSESAVECLYYTSSGAHYEYICTEGKIEEVSALAKSKVQFPVSLGFYEDYEDVMNSFEADNSYLINFNPYIQSTTKDKIESDDLEELIGVEAFNSVTLYNGSFSIIEEGVVLCAFSNGERTYLCVEGKQNKYFEILDAYVGYPRALTCYEAFCEAVNNMGGKDALNIGVFNLNKQNFSTDNTMARSIVINSVESVDFFDTCLSEGYTFTRTSSDVIEMKSSVEGIWYYTYTENGYSEVMALIEEK